MDHEDHLRRHLDLCQRLYRRLRTEGAWPFDVPGRDSTDRQDLVDSESDQNGL